MDRLTYDFAIGENHCWEVHGADNLVCEEVCKNQGDKGCEDCPIRKAIDRLAAYEDTGLEPEEIKIALDGATREFMAYDDLGPIDHLRELVQAEQDGRLVVLPCKVGDTVFAAEEKPVIPLSVVCVGVYLEGAEGGDWEEVDNFSKTVFLTREEAALATQKGDPHETDPV